MDAAFKYEEQASVCTEQSYPYTAEDGSCKASSCSVGIPDHDVTGHLEKPMEPVIQVIIINGYIGYPSLIAFNGG